MKKALNLYSYQAIKEKMDTQTDINWIKSELDKVKDPFLVEAFKNMLLFRNTKMQASISVTELQSRTEESIKAVESGQTITLDEFKSSNKQWLKEKVTK